MKLHVLLTSSGVFVGLLLVGSLYAQSVRNSVGTSLPSNCTAGDEFMKSDAAAGQKKYICIATNTWEQQTGQAGSAVPSGLITFILSGTCPAGWSEVAALNGLVIYGTLAANGDVGGAVGAATITPTVASTSLTAAAQSFTGASGSTSAVSAGTPAGTNSAPTLTMNAYTPAGSVAAPTFTGSAGTVPAETFTGSAGTVPAETFTGSSATTSAVGAGTPTGTIAWPAGVPTASGAAFSVTTTHEASGTSNYVATAMGGTTLASGTTSITLSTQPTIAWPAGVPTFSGSALGTHSHTLTATGTNGTVSFTPAGTNGTVSFTPAGTNSAPAFTGNAATLTGSVAAPTFTGSALGTHSHTLTPTGTNGTSAVTGTITMNSLVPQYSGIKAIFCSKN